MAVVKAVTTPIVLRTVRFTNKKASGLTGALLLM
jgi:hypothetical protein